MANDKNTLNLFYSLVRNTLPETDGYHAVLSHVGTVGEDELYGRVAARRPGLEPSTVGLVMSSICSTVAEILSERQYRITLGDVTFELAIPGSTDSVDGSLSGPAYVAVRASGSLRSAADGLTPVYAAGDGERTEVFSVESLSGDGSGWITGTEPFRIAGVNLSATGDGESVKVTAADGTEAMAEVTDEDGKGRFITAHLDVALPPGKGMVTLTTCGRRTPEGEPMPCTKNVTILADDTPPTPMPTGDEPEVTSGYSSGYGNQPGVLHASADFILEGRNLADASVKVDWTDEGGNARTQNIPAGSTLAEDETITLQQGDWLEACTTLDGAVLTFTVTTSHGSTTYNATVRA